MARAPDASATPTILRTVAELRGWTTGVRAAGGSVAMTPTMGALHAGHLSLAHLGRRTATHVLASIFVNPTQFAPNEDFSKYPRTFDADLALLRQADVEALYMPDATQMYPDGFSTMVSPGGPAHAGLEDRIRPTHFQGVATIVIKLLAQAMPDVALFGEKDYQQLAVITRTTRDLDLPVRIIGAPTVREADGLALSSRNVYLTPAERRVAPALQAALRTCRARLEAGETAADALAHGRGLIEAAGFALDYLELRDAATLEPAAIHAPRRLLAAGTLGRTRLIDNIAVRGDPS